jgi:hypothetical protein
VPYDPYAGGPLHWNQPGKRLVIYSVGMNGIDDGGVRSRNDSQVYRKDVGFALEDVHERGRQRESNR